MTIENGVVRKRKLLTDDPIKIFDHKLTEVSYRALSFADKQRVLTELLFKTALNNLKRHRIIVSRLLLHQKFTLFLISHQQQKNLTTKRT